MIVNPTMFDEITNAVNDWYLVGDINKLCQDMNVSITTDFLFRMYDSGFIMRYNSDRNFASVDRLGKIVFLLANPCLTDWRVAYREITIEVLRSVVKEGLVRVWGAVDGERTDIAEFWRDLGFVVDSKLSVLRTDNISNLLARLEV